MTLCVNCIPTRKLTRFGLTNFEGQANLMFCQISDNMNKNGGDSRTLFSHEGGDASFIQNANKIAVKAAIALVNRRLNKLAKTW